MSVGSDSVDKYYSAEKIQMIIDTVKLNCKTNGKKTFVTEDNECKWVLSHLRKCDDVKSDVYRVVMSYKKNGRFKPTIGDTWIVSDGIGGMSYAFGRPILSLIKTGLVEGGTI